MKNVKRLIALFLVLLFFVPTVAFAEETGTETPDETPTPTEEMPVEEVPEELPPYGGLLEEITEDSPLYFFRELMEGITIEVVADVPEEEPEEEPAEEESGESTEEEGAGEGTEGEATEEDTEGEVTEEEATEEEPEEDTSWKLVISFVNPELFEEEILTPEKLEELETLLIEKITEYLTPTEEDPDDPPTEEPAEEEDEAPTEDPEGESTEEGTTEGEALPAEADAEGEATDEEAAEEEPEEDPEPVIYTIEILLGTGLTELQIEEIILMAECETSKLFASTAFDALKLSFFTAKAEYIAAWNAYRAARKSEGEADAYARWMEAKAHQEIVQDLVDDFGLLRELLKDLMGEDCEMDIEDGPKAENPSYMNKALSNGKGKGLVKNNPYLEEAPEEEEVETTTKTNNGKAPKDKK